MEWMDLSELVDGEDIAGVIPDATIKKLQKALQPKSASTTYQAVAKIVEDMVADGWSATQVVSQVSHLKTRAQITI